jgi:hypothetical protein
MAGGIQEVIEDLPRKCKGLSTDPSISKKKNLKSAEEVSESEQLIAKIIFDMDEEASTL